MAANSAVGMHHTGMHSCCVYYRHSQCVWVKLILYKIVCFASHDHNCQNYGQKTDFDLLRYLYKPSMKNILFFCIEVWLEFVKLIKSKIATAVHNPEYIGDANVNYLVVSNKL